MILSFGSVIISILAFVFALGLIIIIHEGGHFFFARRANILCREYAFGMGPLLWKKKKGETLYRISKRYNCTPDQIRQWNNLENHIISVGQELKLLFSDDF